MNIVVAMFMVARNALMETSRPTLSSRYRLCDMSRGALAHVPYQRESYVCTSHEVEQPPATASFACVFIAVSCRSIFASSPYGLGEGGGGGLLVLLRPRTVILVYSQCVDWLSQISTWHRGNRTGDRRRLIASTSVYPDGTRRGRGLTKNITTGGKKGWHL